MSSQFVSLPWRRLFQLVNKGTSTGGKRTIVRDSPFAAKRCSFLTSHGRKISKDAAKVVRVTLTLVTPLDEW